MRAPFESAVQRHGPTVLRVCRAVLGPGADAEDAWSETFLSALRAWPGLAEDTNVEAWLVRVAHRRAVDVVRRSSRVATPAGDADEIAVLRRRDARTDDDDEPGDTSIWAAVAALPTRQRLCVAYRYLGGLPYAEIAGITGGGEAAARRAAADGVAALRAVLEEDARAHTTVIETEESTP
jgi:RNA polymerase sigma factor (sigma-70 family)